MNAATRLGVVLVVFALLVSPAAAGTIESWSSDSDIMLVHLNLAPNNDDNTAGQGDNLVFLSKVFEDDTPIDILFNVSDSDGVSEYLVREVVDNNTGVDWIGYEAVLGFGTGPQFTSPALLDDLDFDVPNGDGSVEPLPNTFAMVTRVNEDHLLWHDGTQGSAAVNYTFRIDVPDGVDQFTLRQMPILIPEPGTLALLGVALAGMVVAVGRRRET